MSATARFFRRVKPSVVCGKEGWCTIQTWGLGKDWTELQGCVRTSYHLASRKLLFLDRVPYLLARLGEPGVRERCVQEWEACEPRGRHRVTREFLQPGGPLRGYIVAMASAVGGAMHPDLEREVRSLRAIPMDGNVAESPPAIAHRLLQRSPANKWPWVAATVRLAQNLQDAKDIPCAIPVNIEQLWRNSSAVLQGPSSRRQNVANECRLPRCGPMSKAWPSPTIAVEAPAMAALEANDPDGPSDARPESCGPAPPGFCDSAGAGGLGRKRKRAAAKRQGGPAAPAISATQRSFRTHASCGRAATRRS